MTDAELQAKVEEALWAWRHAPESQTKDRVFNDSMRVLARMVFALCRDVEAHAAAVRDSRDLAD